MQNLIGYFKLSLFLLALCAAVVALHYVWVGSLPADAEKMGATLGILFVTGALVAMISTPRAMTSEEIHARNS